MQAVFNTADTHNLVVCTLCSCYPWSVLGLPPVWYKAPPYRSRAVIDPRGVLAEFGLSLAGRRQRSASGIRPPNCATSWCRSGRRDRWLERGKARRPGDARFDDRHRTGAGAGGAHERTARSRRADGVRAGRAREGRAVFPCRLGKARAGVTLCCRRDGRTGRIDESRHARESLHPADYYASSYYEIWIKGLERLLEAPWLCHATSELAAGRAIVPARDAEARAEGRRCSRRAGQGRALRPAGRDAGRVSRPATGCARRISTRAATRGCRAMRAARPGAVEAVRGGFVFPDTNAHGHGENPQWVYTVVFDGARDLGRGERPVAHASRSTPGRAILSRREA